jgi:hypothetical protein
MYDWFLQLRQDRVRPLNWFLELERLELKRIDLNPESTDWTPRHSQLPHALGSRHAPDRQPVQGLPAQLGMAI